MEGHVEHPKREQKFTHIPKTVVIEAENIADADKEFERQFGVNPTRMFRHTPPIKVSIT